MEAFPVDRPRIGWIGCGRMGAALARRLLKAGYDVTVYNRTRAKAEALRNTPEGRKLIRAETRTWVRRDDRGIETVFRVSLDDKLVVIHWGERTAEPRQQRLWYDTDSEARDAYFAKLDRLASEGFVDADAS